MSNLDEIVSSAKPARVVAATKYVGVSEMLNLLQHNIFDFGENRVDSFLEKYDKLCNYKEIKWHFIGTLQTNKVKKMINKIDYLHSLNSVKLASFINKYRTSPLNCFLEVNLTNSSTKTGIVYDLVVEALEEIIKFPNINVIGLMTMTEVDMNDNLKSETFNKLALLKERLNDLGYDSIKHLSMGMSDDYLLAIECGATFVRLGRILFS